MSQPGDQPTEARGLTTSAPLTAYLAGSTMIDWRHSLVLDRARALANGAEGEIEVARACFEWVRDVVAHSWDIQGHRVTVRASEVVEHREGICYAKSHLLAALLRANGIPTGICYQRLTLADDDPSEGYAIHALNTVWLAPLGRWIRLDARGNRPGVDAQFSIVAERLAFQVRPEMGEVDYLVNLPEPHPEIVATLTGNTDALEMYRRGLPSELMFPEVNGSQAPTRATRTTTD